MNSRAHAIDFVRAWAEVMVFGTFVRPVRKYAVGTAFLRGQGSGTVRHVHGLDVIHRELGPLIVDMKLPAPGQAAATTYEGEGYIILRDPDTAVVTRALQRLVSVVKVELG